MAFHVSGPVQHHVFFSGRSRHHSQWFSRGLEGVGLLRGIVQLKDWDVLIPGEVI